MAITAALVKELRERTGCGMMECKNALVETSGDIDAAIEAMRKKGQAKADKKASRIAAEGTIVVKISDDNKTGVILEINCETDFVAKDDNFKSFANSVADCILANTPADVDALSALSLSDGRAIESAKTELITKIGEKVSIRRFEIVQSKEGTISSYLHGVKIGVLVDSASENDGLGRDLSMHIAASKPICINASDVPADVLAKERDIATAQAKDSGKPENIIEKMVEGKVRKFVAGITLLGQAFVKEPDLTIEKLLKKESATIDSFICYEVGDGIEKKQENFAEEVMAQVKG
jgi:elongation factor Ts